MTRRGLTLLEVVLAVSLMVIVAGAAGAFYRQAVRIRGELERELAAIETRRRAMDLMTADLRSALASKFLDMGLEGRPDGLRLVRAGLPGPAAWAVNRITDQPLPAEDDVQLVGYDLATDTDPESGEVEIYGLQRTQQKLLTASVVEEGEALTTQLLCPHVGYLAFRYWIDGAWRVSTGGDMPQAVEITLGVQPPKNETEADVENYPHESFRRVVFVPCSRPGRTTGTVIRGLDGEGG